MGEWLNTYGESIYGTRGGPITPRPWGVTTQKANKVYVHVLDWKEQQLLLPPTDFVITKANLLKNGKSVKFKNDKEGALISIPKAELNEWDAVIELSVKPR
jgi:alpha-L-fucosidase